MYGSYVKMSDLPLYTRACITEYDGLVLVRESLAGNRTIAAPTNANSGQVAILEVKQDGSGSRTLTWNAIYEFKDDTAPTLTTTASKADLFVFYYNGSKWQEMGRNQNLTIS